MVGIQSGIYRLKDIDLEQIFYFHLIEICTTLNQ